MLTCLFTDLEGTIWQQVNLRHRAKLHWHDFKRISYLGLLFCFFVFAGKNPVLVFLVFCAIYLLDLQHTTCSIKRMLSLIVFCNKSDKSLTRSADEVATNIWKGQIYLLIWAEQFWANIVLYLISFESVTFIQPTCILQAVHLWQRFHFHPWQRVHFHFHRRPWRCCRWISPPMDIPWEGWPRPCPLPLSHFFIHLTFFSPLTHPHLKGTCPHLICKWPQHEPDIVTYYIDDIHLSLLFVCLCLSVSASTVSKCLPVSVRCPPVCLFLLWGNSYYLSDVAKHRCHQALSVHSTSITVRLCFTRVCVLGRLHCSRLQ